MVSKRTKSTVQSMVDTISELMRQPLSDQSNEVPTPGAVRRSKASAAGPRRRKATKAKTKTKKSPAKKRTTGSRKAKSKARKKR